MSRLSGVALRLAVVLVVPSVVVAQTNSWLVGVPSPTAASLGRFGDVPVGLYTGTPDISIPLFTVKGKTLELPISLAYHASGVRVEEIGGWVGTGWSLEAGGVITRTMRGLPDDWDLGYYNTGNAFYSADWPAPSLNFLLNMYQGHVDGEPDQFFINLGGRTAQIVIGPTGPALSSQEVRTIPYMKWRIVPTFGANSQWVVTTEDGTRYTFAAREDHISFTPFQTPLVNPYTASWYLTGIHAPGGDSISLQYQSYAVRHDLGVSGEQRDEATGPCIFGPAFQYTNSDGITEQRLSSITAAAQTVSFTASLRTDALNAVDGTQQEYRLDQMTVNAAGGPVIRQFQLGYDYSIGNPGRLTLTSVTEKDPAGNALPPYTFAYSGPQLPARSSTAQDHWGYYNGKTGNTNLIPVGRSAITGTFYPGANRSPDSASMLAGSLTRITYPTGGYNDLIYEPNDYSYSFIGNALLTDSTPEFQSPAATAPTGTSTQSFTVGGIDTAGAVMSIMISSQPSCTTNCARVELLTAAGGPTGYGPWTTNSNQGPIWLAPGIYKLNAYPGDFGTTVVGGVKWRELISVPRKRGGGLRIAELRTADVMGGISILKYKYRLSSDSSRSSGMVEAQPVYDYNFYAQTALFPGGTPGPTCGYYSRSVMSKMPLGGGPPVAYTEVSVWHGANAEFGRERHVFQGPDVAPDVMMGWPFHRRTNFNWRWGQEKLVQTFDAAGRIQRAVSSTWHLADDSVSYRDFHGMSLIVVPNTNNPPPDMSAYPVFNYAHFLVTTAWKYKDSETVTTYDTTGTASVSTTKTFAYGNPHHAQLTQLTETNSDGSQRMTRFRYPADFKADASGDPETAALFGMQQDNIQSAVVEKLVSQKIGSTELVVEGDLTTFRTFAPHQYLPYQHFVLNSPTPIP